mmetsp:Transcript_38858/g.77079  ORF Transcript_38858/g.77079 Transcript_38858/m.77079 type:complete len:430 (+) Transcript_38858:65-1354(+)|eukprot:CAMPEP_0172722440 /NCGR_PEP_ID=MMETSP1074-20121228/81463_1 /TAXON_ID=2916 /ORGANISM="Ceratium fusus, Strain PA161109" /LENGTH=429 /DNA_ID=CAMNT_0013548451 /DNA_START=70 /DNA_END=1359 /DNA_ORIENTATION=+
MSDARRVGRNQDFRLRSAKFGVGLSWDAHPGSKVDLDLQAVAFDVNGRLTDAVYYNNLKACGRGLTHSGDEVTGVKKGFDELIWVNVTKLPQEVALIVFIVACFKGGMIREARNACYHVLEDNTTKEIGKFALNRTGGKAAIVGNMLKGAAGWTFRSQDISARHGQHFIDMLEPTIGDFVRSVIPSAPRRIKAAFAMEKGAVVELPASDVVPKAVAALGWDTLMGEVDLDVSAILMDKNACEVECCFFGNEEAQGVTHSGDNLTGHGAGDSETITVELQALAPVVEQIFFVINIYTQNRTFGMVSNPYCRIVTPEGEEFCRYQLKDAGQDSALIMARLFREPGDCRWGFQAVGTPCRGRTYKDSMPAVIKQARTRPQELMTRSMSSASLDGTSQGAQPSARPLVDDCLAEDNDIALSDQAKCGAACSVQ